MTRVLCVPVYMGACRPAASFAMRGNMSTQQRVRVLENRARAEVQLDSVLENIAAGAASQFNHTRVLI